MSEAPSLRDQCILVVEDEYLIAEDLREGLEIAGASVLGPASSVDRALALIDTEPVIDGAVLDLSLDGVLVFPAADMLIERRVPFVFTTGFDKHALPERYAGVMRCEKPVNPSEVASALLRCIQANRQGETRPGH